MVRVSTESIRSGPNVASFNKLPFAQLVRLMDILEDAGFAQQDVEYFIQNPNVLTRMRRNFVAAERTPVKSLRPMAIEMREINMLESILARSENPPVETADDNEHNNKL